MSVTLRYARASSEDLRAYLATNLNGYVDTISNEEAWSPALTHPSTYRGAKVPLPDDAIAVEVDCDGFDPDDLHNNVWYSDCFVRFWYRLPDSDLEQHQRRLRSYASALVRCLMADPSLGNAGDYDAQVGRTDFPAISEGDGYLAAEFVTHVLVKREET